MTDTNSVEFKSDFRKLDFMLKDLKDMYIELNPDGGMKTNEDLKNMDKWQRKKYDLNKKLGEVREGVRRLDDAKRTLAVGQRDAEVIKLHAENAKALKEANTMWTELKQIFIDDEQKNKKKLDKKTLSDRRALTKNLGKELMELHNKNSRVQQAPGGETKLSSQAGEEDLSKLDRDARREKRLEKKREERRRTKNKRRGRGGSRKEDDELDDFQEPKPMSAQEQAFIEEKDSAYKEQDAILEEISKGLDELHEIGLAMNKNLKLQEHMLEELDTKIVDQTEAFKNANARLKNLLDESGGISRWCPIVICAIIFIALLGVIYSIVR